MKQQVSFLIIATVLLASCQREQDWDGAPDIKASVEAEPKTRTSLSVDESGAGTIYWNPADKIDVFFGTTKASYTSQNAADAITALFKTTDSFSGSGFSSTNIWGLYPSNSTSSCDGSAITTTLPSTQYGVPNTFDNDLFMAVAHSTSTSLQFYNVCGGIKFNLAYDDIKKVTFRGNNNEDLAGTVSISFVDGLPKATIVNGVKEISLTPKTGATFTKGADYYFTLLPCTLSEGFTMEFTTVDGSVAFLNYDESPVTIKRSVFSKKGNLDVYASFGDDRQPNNVIYYTSTDGQIVTPKKTDDFGADIVSNEYVGGRGVITFDGDVTSIGDSAFSGCSDLSSISIPNSVTRIGDYAFIECSGLTSIVIPFSVTSIDHFNPFTGCSSLEIIRVDPGNSVYDSRDNCNAIINSETNSLLSGCKSTVIPNTVTSIGSSAFYRCRSLTNIEIPSSVTSIDGDAFMECSGLTSIEIPSSVTRIGRNPFRSCSSLATIRVNSLNTVYDSRDGSNTIIETKTNRLITGCKSTTIPISVTGIMSFAFEGSYGLSQIEIPPSVTYIGESAFRACMYLEFIILRASSPSVLGYPSDAFALTNNCPIYVPAESVDAYKSAWSEYADRIYPMVESHEAVDLGLSVKWASCNIGASSPEEYGDYYAWGETEPKGGSSQWSNYTWCNGSSSSLTKYNIHSDLGTVDYKIGLDLDDDAAHVNWGGNWRMPTMTELEELHYQCTWTWTTQGGKNGYRVTGPNGNSIFLPASGYWAGSSLNGAGTAGAFWSSTLWPDESVYASLIIYNSGTVSENGFDRVDGMTIRPVCAEYVSVESVSLNKSSLTLMEGESEYLDETISPSNATEKTVSWSSDNPSVATASYWHGVTAVSPGTATITAWSADGQKTATCTVTVIAGTHEAVDLGLSVKWATCNLGANEPEEYGDCYAWGETSTKSSWYWNDYVFFTGYDSENRALQSKYVTDSKYGTVDGRTQLDLSDDAARKNWGGGWRMPTSEEFSELWYRCTWTWTSQDGKNGYLIRSPGTLASIFLPAAGWEGIGDVGTRGLYWSSTLCEGSSAEATALDFDQNDVTFLSYNVRCTGLHIRPVREE